MPDAVRRNLASFALFALVALAAQIPFELRHRVFGLSNLQWTFVAVVLLSAPDLIANWKKLAADRLVQAATLFVAIQWMAAAFAPEFHTNAFKAAARFTAGLMLLVIARQSAEWNLRSYLSKTWVIASAAAGIYALAEYAGYGAPWLFRTAEFYIGQTQRLSGSFEYPNTAGAYFAMSLPIVWWSELRPVLRAAIAFFLWCAIILTFSKGALVAAAAVMLVARPKAALPVLAIGAAAYAALLPFNPYLPRAFSSMRNPIAANYATDWNKLRQKPNALDKVPLQVQNTGLMVWISQGRAPFALGYRWWNPETGKFLPEIPVITPLPHNVSPGETVSLSVDFRTPMQSGNYVLAVELFSGTFNWFSRIGVVPALIEGDIETGADRVVAKADLSSLYMRGHAPDSLTAAVPRSSLWRAALRMFRQHPFGVGPDNYRLEYGNYLGARGWDKSIYSNNLYLELLTGSGFLGLAAFGAVILAMKWRRTAPASMAVAVFLVHGVVDVFLMTTPIYFAFWFLAGSAASSDSPPFQGGVAATSIKGAQHP